MNCYLSKAFKLVLSIGFVFVISGCATKYSCGADEGMQCSSLSDVYDAREAGTLKHQQPKTADVKNKNSNNSKNNSSKNIELDNLQKSDAIQIRNVEPGSPLLTRPDVLRVYVNRHEADGDLHDEQFIYLRLDSGHWLLTAE